MRKEKEVFKYLGLEIEEDQMLILYAKWHKKHIKILASTCIHLLDTKEERQNDDGTFLESKLRAFMKQTKARPNGTGICIHPREVWRREIQMPIFMEKHMETYLPTQVEGWAHEDRSTYTFTGIQLIRNKKKDKRLEPKESVPYCIMACKKEKVLAPYQLLEHLHCTPQCVTTIMDTLPTYTLLKGHPKHYMIVLEKKLSWYVGFYQDNVCTFVQVIPKHHDQELGFELNKLVSFYGVNHNQLQVEQLYLLGLVGTNEALEQELKEYLEIEIVSLEMDPSNETNYSGIISLFQYMHQMRRRNR